MLKFFKKIYNKFKKIFWLLGFITISLVITFKLMISFVNNNSDVIVNFVNDPNITQEILPFSFLSLIIILLFIALVILTTIFVIKLIFPNTKAFNSLLMKDHFEFLVSLPSQFRKGGKKDV